jgi:hypothetical protein
MHAEANPLGLSYINTYLQGSWKNEKKERIHSSKIEKKNSGTSGLRHLPTVRNTGRSG